MRSRNGAVDRPGRLTRLLAATVIVTALSAGTPPAPARAAAHGDDGAVTAWARQEARRLATVDPDAPLTDLRHLNRALGDATIVGLGEATHGSAELTGLKHRVLRLLVTELGYRSIAWEEDWSLGLQINEYLRTGTGDLAALVNRMSTAWRSAETVDVLRWLRDWNVHHEDVTFVGTEAYATRPMLYDLVEAYIAERAPERLAEARTHLAELTPDDDDMGAYVQWYWFGVPDKAPYVRHAHDLYDLVAAVAHRPGDREHELYLQHTRQIVGFYEQFADANPFAFRDVHAARNLRWWQRFAGGKVAYWAANGHTLDGPALRLVQPEYPALEFAGVGSFLRDWYGRRYLSVGFTLDRGDVVSEGRVVTMPPAAADWLEAPFAPVAAAQFTLDLRREAPRPVRRWLDAPTRTRAIPEGGHGSYLIGGTPRQWFDLVVHRQVSSPVTAL